MKGKPENNPKHRNLYAYRGSIWYDRVANGQRFRLDLETTAWEEAVARRDAYEERKGVAKARTFTGRVLLFADAAPEALQDMDARRNAEAETAYSATTAPDRRRALRERGPILAHLGGRRLDTIDAATLRRWHDAEGGGAPPLVQDGREPARRDRDGVALRPRPGSGLARASTGIGAPGGDRGRAPDEARPRDPRAHAAPRP